MILLHLDLILLRPGAVYRSEPVTADNAKPVEEAIEYGCAMFLTSTAIAARDGGTKI